ncbi:MAG: NYN domain-containing protein, partial [Nitrospirota bacterium]|nr:NYN domain-containing protein [Nitrospirota bacterium]
VIFSKQGEKADLVIKRRIESASGTKGVVVSSDHEITRFAESHGWSVVESSAFDAKLWDVFYEAEYGKVDDDDDERQASKKGNPRRLSKAARKKQGILKKL